MRYQKFRPATELLPFVECFFVWEGEAPDTLDVQSPPNGFGAMVFNYGDQHLAFQNNGQPSPVPVAFVSGQFTSNYHLLLKGKIGMVGIVFKPSTLHNFFELPMSHLVNSRIPLSLFPEIQSGHLSGSLKAQTSDADRIKILEEFTLTFVSKAKTRLTVIDEAIDYIDEHHGCLSVEAVAAYLKISRRYLEKQFLEKVGVSPKFYSRIKRFSIISKKVHSKKVDWQDVVNEYGLHDQSHLVKEFREFNKMNPTEYHEKHHELIRFVKP